MDIYLPVAGVSENVLLLLALGGGIGFLSGLFGVGGGFLLTPLLIMMGIPPAVAVGSGANQVLGASVSGTLAHWRRGTVDVRMGVILLAGGLVGSTLGVWLFAWLKALGQIELVINLCYVLLLGTIGGLMMLESLSVLLRRGGGRTVRRKLHSHPLLHRLPGKMRFPRSRLYISAIPPLVIGVGVGLLSAIMGVGGGFVMVPAMIYLLQMPTQVVIGTSLFQIVFVTANVTFMQATTNQAVDVVLSVMLLFGGVVGAQVGSGLGRRLGADQMRFLLALMVLAMGVKMAVDLMVTPEDAFSLASAAS
ncbi:sulfite exporter TauE/SafE family protein [Novispirillum sp. DQ9]|uniref:sulfite exporter TauE/SafE family protein n=1 Tax=Novispirillum sp. DQ9 TaxID=3398612 RepID=UPI003C7B1017